MSFIKHGTITTEKITENTWVARTVTYEIMRAEIEIKGESEQNAFTKLINFIESEKVPFKIEPNLFEGFVYHFNF